MPLSNPYKLLHKTSWSKWSKIFTTHQ